MRFKTVSGKTDQAAGLVVRYKDKDNYYVVRANALEDNVNLYKVRARQSPPVCRRRGQGGLRCVAHAET